ncbi:MAG TPA: DUF3105 domain-containing protein [Methylomirabilota bacterium]|nr:DUF3105 domain-containing protein [Methylomirabilota bacterium]
MLARIQGGSPAMARMLGGAAWAGVVLGVLGWTIGGARAQTADGPGRLMPDRGAQHVAQGTHITYPEYPPTSGPHWPRPAEWGIYTTPVPEEQFVHNLEHGGIVILYRCPGGCPDLVRELDAIVRTLPPSKYGHRKVVLSPNDRIPSRIALLAWRRLEELDAVDREGIVRFVRAYQDRGPEDVP